MFPRPAAFDVVVNPPVVRRFRRIRHDNPTGVRLFEFGSGTSLKGFRFPHSLYCFLLTVPITVELGLDAYSDASDALEKCFEYTSKILDLKCILSRLYSMKCSASRPIVFPENVKYYIYDSDTRK